MKYLLLCLILIVFFSSLLSIKYIEDYKKKYGEKYFIVKHKNFIIPLISIFSFFIGCYVVSSIINENKPQDKYIGIIYLLIIACMFLYVNINILNKDNILEFIKGKKYSPFGATLSIGIGALLFGFLDNFGMKLGIEALDDMFVLLFLGPFSIHKKFESYEKNIYKNIAIVNEWGNKDWRRIINQCMRYQTQIMNNKELDGLSNAIKKFGSKKLDIPESIKQKELTNEYVDNIRRKYNIIHDSKAMLGNTFSNVIAALLGGAVLNIFIYLTLYDDTYLGDKKIHNHFFIKNRENISPLIEMVFIFIGCIIPIFLHIAMEKSEYVSNRSWIVIYIVFVLMIIMMYISYKSIEPMTFDDKKISIKQKLMTSLKRCDISEKSNEKEKDIYLKCMEFINTL